MLYAGFRLVCGFIGNPNEAVSGKLTLNAAFAFFPVVFCIELHFSVGMNMVKAGGGNGFLYGHAPADGAFFMLCAAFGFRCRSVNNPAARGMNRSAGSFAAFALLPVAFRIIMPLAEIVGMTGVRCFNGFLIAAAAVNANAGTHSVGSFGGLNYHNPFAVAVCFPIIFILAASNNTFLAVLICVIFPAVNMCVFFAAVLAIPMASPFVALYAGAVIAAGSFAVCFAAVAAKTAVGANYRSLVYTSSAFFAMRIVDAFLAGSAPAFVIFGAF